MQYKCNKCESIKNISFNTKINMRCGDCAHVEGTFDCDAVMHCGHCGRKRYIEKGDMVNVKNTCHGAREMGQNTLWFVEEHKTSVARDESGRFVKHE